MFEEAVQIVRGLLTTDGFTFEGRHFQVHDATLLTASGAATAPADLDRRVGREAHDADRGALRRRVALLRPARVPRDEVGAHQRARDAAGRDPSEIRRAASLSLEADLDGVAPHDRRVGGGRLRLPRVRLAERRPGARRTVRAAHARIAGSNLTPTSVASRGESSREAAEDHQRRRPRGGARARVADVAAGEVARARPARRAQEVGQVQAHAGREVRDERRPRRPVG